MPMYEYQCESCGSVEDKIFPISEKPQEYEAKCEACDQITTFTCIMSAPMIVSGVGGFKTNVDFQSRLNQIKKENPGMRSSVTG